MLHIFVLFAFAIAQPVYDLLAKNAGFFVARHASAAEILSLTVVLSLALPLAIALAIWLCGYLHSTMQKSLFGIVVALLVSCIVLPLLKHAFGADVSLIFATLVGVLTIVAYFKFQTLQSFLSWLSPAALVFPLLFLFSADVGQLLGGSEVTLSADKANIKHKAVNKTPPPIVMLVLDEFPLLSLLNASGDIDAESFPHIAGLASKAYWFRNASTVSEDTLSAVPAILTGRYPRASDDGMPMANARGYPDNIFTLLGHSYDLNVTEPVTQLCPEHLCIRETNKTSFVARLGSTLADLKVIYLHFLMPVDYASNLPPVDHTWKNFAAEGAGVVKQNGLTDIDAVQALQQDRKIAFKQFVQRIKTTDKPAFHFLHSMLPHRPYDYLPSGKLHSVNSNEYALHSNRWNASEQSTRQASQRHLLQVGFVDGLIGELAQHLKQHSLYDKSLIVITSDHGASFQSNDLFRSNSPNNSHQIMAIPLIVKLPAQTAGVIETLNAETVDIVPTLLDVAGIDAPWTLDGRSLVSETPQPREVKTIYHQHAANAFKIPHREFLKQNEQALAQKTSLLSNTTSTDLLYSSIESAEQIVESAAAITFDQHNFFNNVSADDGLIPAHLSGSLKRGDVNAEMKPLPIAVNGTLLATAGVKHQKPADQIVIFLNNKFFHAGSPNRKRPDVVKTL